jgi:proteasome accessory factor C
MKSFEHIYQLHRLLKQARYPVPAERVSEELKCSPATTKRVLRYLRDVLNAPLETSREPRGYRYTDDAYELPGFWFSATELQSLLTFQQLLASFQPGLLDDALNPLRKRLDEILLSQGLKPSNAARIRLLRSAARPVGNQIFPVLAAAVLQRKRLELHYQARGTGQRSTRQVSPQRLTHYRDNWYLDAWCHQSAALRIFATDRIEAARLLEAAAEDTDEQHLDQTLGASYGIFSGAPTAIAVLRFSAERARWIAAEQWHPQQQAQWLPDGTYELRIPYRHDEELILDILRYGPDVQVLSPHELRQVVKQRLQAAIQKYL